MKTNICLLSILILLFSCLGNSNKKKIKESSGDSCEIVKSDTMGAHGRKILYSTVDLLNAKLLSLEELSKKLPSISLSSDKIESLNMDGFIIIGRYKSHNIIIEYIEGDNLVYYIGCVKTKLFFLNDGVNVSPEWGEPENEINCYEKRKFELYTDYLLRVDTEEMLDGVKKKYTKYYRINDEGKFYEVKE